MMALSCPAIDGKQALVQGLIGSVDCNVHGLAEGGYAALSGPASPVGALLTALLTVYVAFIGYRLLLGGGGLRMGEMSVSVMKIGLVLALATNGSLFETLIYDTVFKAPAEVGALLLQQIVDPAAGLGRDPFTGLQTAFDQLQMAAGAFSARSSTASATFQGGPGFAAFAVNTGGMVMLLSMLGAVLATKIVLAILLALTPLVAGMLLFETTRGLVEGWLKALIALALAPMIATLALTMEMAMMAPSLHALAAMRQAQQFAELDMGPAITVLVLTLVFAFVLAVAAAALGFIASGLRLPRRQASTASIDAGSTAAGARYTSAEIEPRSRAAVVAAAVVSQDRRLAAASPALTALGGGRRVTVTSARSGASAAQTPAAAIAPHLGASFRRPTTPRRSAASARRDL